MIFGKTTTIEDAKKNAPELVAQIEAEAKAPLQEEMNKLSAKIQKMETEQSIRTYATKFGLEELGEQLIEAETSFDGALKSLADAHLEKASNLDNSLEEDFDGSGSSPLGSVDDGGLGDFVPKTREEAADYVKDRDNISYSDAMKKAANEFASLEIFKDFQ